MELLLNKGVKYLEKLTSYDKVGFLEHFVKPVSRSELYLITNGQVQFSQLGSTRTRQLVNGDCYYFKPRNRGSEVFSISEDFSCRIASVNPIYAQEIFREEETSKLRRITGSSSFEKDLYISLIQQNEVLLNQILSDQIDQVMVNKKYALLKEAMQSIQDANGIITIKEIYTSLNVSKSTLEQLFWKAINMTPKEYARIVRLNHFIGTYKSSDNDSLTEITYQCGFYDQSHLIKEFRYFLDQTPSKYFKTFS